MFYICFNFVNGKFYGVINYYCVHFLSLYKINYIEINFTVLIVFM